MRRIRWKTAIMLVFLLCLIGCAEEKEIIEKQPAAENTVVTEVYSDADIFEMEEVEKLAADIERGTCPVSEKLDCEMLAKEIGLVCGSDDITYDGPCEACGNADVENWIEGEC